MTLYVHLKDCSCVSFTDVDTITRVDPFKTIVVNGVILDYGIVSHIWYINEEAPAGERCIYIFEDNRFVSARYDVLKYIQPIKVEEGVAFNV